MYRFRTIILETPHIEDYTQLQTEIDRLIADALEANGNCQLVNVQVTPLGERSGSSGTWTIFLYTVEVLEATPVPPEPAQGV